MKSKSCDMLIPPAPSQCMHAYSLCEMITSREKWSKLMYAGYVIILEPFAASLCPFVSVKLRHRARSAANVCIIIVVFHGDILQYISKAD